MRVFVTGVNGQLGHDCMNELRARGYEAIGSDIQEAAGHPADADPAESAANPASCDRAAGHPADADPAASAANPARYVRLDITDSAAVSKTIEEIHPDVIIHCAAWTAVDAAEDAANRPKVFAINADGTRHIAQAAAKIDAKMVYISTDYIFDGTGERPWQPDDADYAPLNVYGQSKLDGELAVQAALKRFFIVRIAWVFGVNGNNFIKTMLRIGQNHDTLRVVNDQIGTPTYTYDLARLLVDMIETDQYGIYHATNEGGYISWYDFAVEIFRQAGMQTKVLPVTTAEYGLSKAARPFNSRLDKSKLVEAGFKPLPEWKDALERYLKVIGAARE